MYVCTSCIHVYIHKHTHILTEMTAETQSQLDIACFLQNDFFVAPL